MRCTFTSLSFFVLASIGRVAFAQDAGPHHAHAGALLALADEETKIVFAVITAKVFDVELAKTLVGELKEVIGNAKSSAFRAGQLVEDQKGASDLAKFDEVMRSVETSLQKLDADLASETKGIKVDDEGADIAPAAGAGKEEAGPQPNWELLKDDVGGLYRDIGSARAQHGKLAKIVKASPLKAPPLPKKR